MSSVGYATLQVIPSFKGIDAAISKELNKGALGKAAANAGNSAGDAMSTGLMARLGAGLSNDKLLKVGKVATLALGAGIAAGLGASVFAFSDFERSMNEVFTLLPGISQDAMGKMTGQVKDFSKEFGVLPDQVVPALYQAISAGVPQGNVFDFLEVAQKAAKGGVTDLTTAVDGLSSVVNAYGPDVLSAGQASDLMFTSVRLGKTTMDELSKSLFNVTPTAAALGVKFGDVTAALAAMTSQGIPTAVATTQLRQMFVELSKSGQVASDTFEKIAGKSFKDFIAAGGNTQQALQLMEQYAASTGVSVNDLFSSVEAGSAALTLTGQGTDVFSADLAAMSDSAGATDAAFGQMNQGLGPLVDKFKAWGQVMLIEVGGGLAKVIEWMTEHKGVAIALAGIVGGVLLVAIGAYIASMISAAAATIAATWPILAIIAAVGALVAGLVWAYNNVDWFRTAVDAAWTAIQVAVDWVKDHWEIALVAMMGPIGLLAAVVIDNWDKITGAISWAWSNVIQPVWSALSGFVTDWLIPAFQTLWAITQVVWAGIVAVVSWAWSNVIQPVFAAVWGFITNTLVPAFQVWWGVVQTVWAGIAAVVSWAWNEILFPIFNGIWTWIQNNLIPAWNATMTAAQIAWGAIATAVQWAWDNVISPVWNAISGFIQTYLIPYMQSWWDTVQTVWGAVGSVISSVWNSVISPTFEAIKSGIGFVIDMFNTIKDAIATAFSAVADTIIGPFKSGFNAIANLWNNTVGQLSVHTPDIPGTDWGGIDFTMPKIPTFHTGGVVPGVPGQEVLAMLQAGEVVTPAAQVAAGATAGRSTQMVNHFHSVNASARDITEEQGWLLRLAG